MSNETVTDYPYPYLVVSERSLAVKMSFRTLEQAQSWSKGNTTRILHITAAEWVQEPKYARGVISGTLYRLMDDERGVQKQTCHGNWESVTHVPVSDAPAIAELFSDKKDAPDTSHEDICVNTDADWVMTP